MSAINPQHTNLQLLYCEMTTVIYCCVMSVYRCWHLRDTTFLPNIMLLTVRADLSSFI